MARLRGYSVASELDRFFLPAWKSLEGAIMGESRTVSPSLSGEGDMVLSWFPDYIDREEKKGPRYPPANTDNEG